MKNPTTGLLMLAATLPAPALAQTTQPPAQHVSPAPNPNCGPEKADRKENCQDTQTSTATASHPTFWQRIFGSSSHSHNSPATATADGHGDSTGHATESAGFGGEAAGHAGGGE